MKLYYADVTLDRCQSGISLVAIEVKETSKLYIVQSKREITGICFDIRIPKDSDHVFKTLPEAIKYIAQSVTTQVDNMQEQITKLHDKEAKLIAAYKKHVKESHGQIQ